MFSDILNNNSERGVKLEKTYINYIDRAIKSIRKFAFDHGGSYDDLFVDDEFQSAIALKLVIIGESVDKLSKYYDIRNRFPEINWGAVKGTRNWLAHDYFSVDFEVIYDICESELEIIEILILIIIDTCL